VGKDGCLQGKIEAADLLGDEGVEGEAGERAREMGHVFLETESVSEALEGIQDFVGNSVPVVRSEEERVLVGMVTEADLVRAYVAAVGVARDEVHGV
jgi:CBS domain-containing protein